MSDSKLDPPTGKSTAGTTAKNATAFRTLEGKWSMRDWRHDHEDADKEYTKTADAEIFPEEGGMIHGRFKNQQGDYKFSGHLKKESVFTGTWERDLEGVGGIWHGAFQFKVLDHADRMLGLWVGITKNEDRINWGTWEWKRHGVEDYPSEIEEHLSLLPPSSSFWPAWRNLPTSGKVAIIVASITAFGGIIAAIVMALPEIFN